MAEAVTPGLEASDCFLEGFLISLSDTHDLTHRAHLRSKLIFHAFKFLKGPAGEFDYHIIAVRYIFIQCPVLSTGNILESKTCGQHCRNQGNGEAGGFGCKCR